MLSQTSILRIVEKNAAELGISPDDLGKIGELIAKSISDVVFSRDFAISVSESVAKREKQIAFGVGIRRR